MDQIYINGMKIYGSKQDIGKLEHYIQRAGAKLENSFGNKDSSTPVSQVDLKCDKKFVGTGNKILYKNLF
jgi:hypothetical protein